MGNIVTLNNKLKTSEMDEAIEGFVYLFQMPDSIFDNAYPEMKKEFLKTVQSGEFRDSFLKEGTSESDKKDALEGIKALEDLMNDEDLLSENKRDFLKLIIEYSKKALDDLPNRDVITVSLELCHENAKEPTYANPNDAGCDIYAVEDTTILAGETKIIRTGLKIAIPVGWMISVRPRSGMSVKTGIRVANAPGTIKVA